MCVVIGRAKMKHPTWPQLLLIVLLVSIGRIAGNARLVEVKSGEILGRTVEFSHEDVDVRRTLHVFKGIPYAEPPVGDLRFSPPKAKKPWEGVYDATEYKPMCIQPYNPFLPLEEPESEDCLFLNVFAPQSQAGLLPVMVWIHGGAFNSGSGSAKFYDGFALSAIGEVIVVTINYRLGALGFFLTGDDYVTGNHGLLDQLAALQWIQENIEAFGGDASRVTVFGESAGSVSIDFLVLSPLSDGLFQRAIMQSGTATIVSYPGTDAVFQNRIAHGLGKVLGCENDTSEDLVQCLRSVPAENFRDPSDPPTGLIASAIGETLDGLPFAPFVDGHVITGSPQDIFGDGNFTRSSVDILIGTNADEGTFGLAMVFHALANESEISVDRVQFEGLYKAFLSGPAKRNPIAHEAIELMYIDWENVDSEDADYADSFAQIVGDQMFVCPTDQTARLYSEAGAKVYRYFMTHVPAKPLWGIAWVKAAHGEEIPFVFGYHFLNTLEWTMPKSEVDMSLKIIEYWTNFAKTGNPGLSDGNAELSEEDIDLEWPTFKVPGLEYKEISVDMENKRALKARECAFWNDFLPKLIKLTDYTTLCSKSDEKTKYSKEANP